MAQAKLCGVGSGPGPPPLSQIPRPCPARKRIPRNRPSGPVPDIKQFLQSLYTILLVFLFFKNLVFVDKN